MSTPSLFLFSFIFASLVALALSGSFVIENDRFVRDGVNFTILSGDVHYFRIPRSYWLDRLLRLKALGLNAITTYVPWNFHEQLPGVYNFEADRDLVSWIKTAQEVGFVVLLRPGPYICGEWDFGGLPWWLMQSSKNLTLRTYASPYIDHVTTWLPRMKPLLYQNGGPIVMVQIENEYGFFGNVKKNPNDKKYIKHLISIARSTLGNDILLYTTDGGSNIANMEKGSLPGDAVFTTGDMGPSGNFANSFNAQKQYNSPGKSANIITEFYSGWLTHWGEFMANTSTSVFIQSLKQIFSLGGSVSIYMGHGGTNFGFWAGANLKNNTLGPHITSYDYDCQISEGGDHGYGSDGVDKYLATLAVLSKINPEPIPPEPAPIPKTAYGPIVFTESVSLWDVKAELCKDAVTRTHNDRLDFEAMGIPHGFALYSFNASVKEARLCASGPATLSLKEMHDWATVFVNQSPVQAIFRPSENVVVNAPAGKISTFDILVESMGHQNFGPPMIDFKGVSSIALGSTTVPTLSVCPLPLFFGQVGNLPYSAIGANPPVRNVPTFLRGYWTISSNVTDTYLDFTGWTKGIIWINGINLGRYWNIGPQYTLYVPAEYLVGGVNEVILLELAFSGSSSWTLTSVNVPKFVH